MRKLTWAAVSLVTAMSGLTVFFGGCGSENEAGITGTDAGKDGTPVTPPADDGGIIPSEINAGICKEKGVACAAGGDCCSGNCTGPEGAQTCGDAIGCQTPGQSCLTAGCCTTTCTAGTCSTTLCQADTKVCNVNSDCCNGNCVRTAAGTGECQTPTSTNPPPPPPPKQCTTPSQCPSGYCSPSGVCANPGFCTVLGDTCASDTACCSGRCNKAPGATSGSCAPLTTSTGCKTAGELCGPTGTCTGADCCSRSCAPSPTSGVAICQQESGCRMIGNICQQTSDCCGVKDQPGSIKTFNGGLDGGSTDPSTNVTCAKSAGATFGTCTYVQTVCSSAGQLCKPGNETTGGAQACSTKIDCCSGNANQFPTCQIDENGIPRCTIASRLNCANPIPAGTACATSADCCGNPCIKNPSGTSPAFICATPGTCRQQGESCTSTGDCCTGLPCAIPQGASTGVCGGTVLADGGVVTNPPSDGGVFTNDAGTVCAGYGQDCVGSGTGNCCAGVPCINSTCHYQ
jgi:hypothetical protein